MDEREFWIGIRRSLIAMVKLIERRFPVAEPFKPGQENPLNRGTSFRE